MKNKFQRGVALVSTLIMLSVVVLMAVAFLAVSRRERASVRVGHCRPHPAVRRINL